MIAARIATLGFHSNILDVVIVISRTALELRSAGHFVEHVIHDNASLESLGNAQESHAINIISMYPRPKLWDYLREKDIPAIVVIDDTVSSIEKSMKASLGSLEQIMRHYSMSLSGLLHPKLRSPHIVLHAGARALTMAAILRRLAPMFEPPLSEQEQAVVLDRMGALPSSTLESEITRTAALHVSPSHTFQDFTREDEAFIISSLGGITNIALGNTQNIHLLWGSRLFFDGSTYAAPSGMTLDLTGPARCVFYGPYMHLPTGKWRGEAVVGFSKSVLNSDIKLEVVAMESANATFSAKVRKGGIYSLPFEFNVVDPLEPLQFRILTAKGEIEGRIALASVKLTFVE